MDENDNTEALPITDIKLNVEVLGVTENNKFSLCNGNFTEESNNYNYNFDPSSQKDYIITPYYGSVKIRVTIEITSSADFSFSDVYLEWVSDFNTYESTTQSVTSNNKYAKLEFILNDLSINDINSIDYIDLEGLVTVIAEEPEQEQEYVTVSTSNCYVDFGGAKEYFSSQRNYIHVYTSSYAEIYDRYLSQELETTVYVEDHMDTTSGMDFYISYGSVIDALDKVSNKMRFSIVRLVLSS